jgi:hypothetical protein
LVVVLPAEPVIATSRAGVLAPALAVRAGDLGDRDARIVDLDHRRAAELAGVGAPPAGDHHRGGAGRDRRAAEGVAVELLALHRDVQIAGRGDAAVDDDAIADRRAGRAAAGAGGDRVDVEARPQRARRGGLLAIVEVDLGGAEDLVVLVALAGDHHDVARRGLGHRRADRGAAIDVDVERVGHRRQDRVEDGPRIFGARVVAGHHRQVGLGRDRRAHLGPLGGIAIAAAAEHADQPATGQRPQRGQHVVERVRGVRVVDQDVEAGGVGHPLDAAGHAGQRLDAARDRGVRQPERLTDAHRQRDVGDVVVADQRVRPDGQLAARGLHAGGDAGDRRALLDYPDRRAALRLVERALGRRHVQHGPRLRGGGGRRAHGDAGGIVDVDHRDAGPRQLAAEQQLLGLGVLLHRAVEVEVILRQVGERADRELDAGQAVHRQRRRRHLHHHVGHAIGDHPGERLVQHLGRRRGVRRVVALAAPAVVDRADHARLVAGGAQHRLDQVRGRGLAVGAGDADQRQPPRRVIGQRRDRVAQRARAVGDDQLRHREPVDRGLDHHRRGAALDRGRDEGVAVAAPPAHRHEQRAGADRPRVRGHRAHLGVGAVQAGTGDRADQFGELHRALKNAEGARFRPGWQRLATTASAHRRTRG